jgi:hypothetical protein
MDVDVKDKSKDTHGKESPYSDPLPVSISKTRNYNRLVHIMLLFKNLQSLFIRSFK